MQLTSFTSNRQFKLFQKVVTVRSVVDSDRVMLADEEGNERMWEIATLHIHYRSGNLKGIKNAHHPLQQRKVTVAMRLSDNVSETAKRQGFARQKYLAAVHASGVALCLGNKRLQDVLEGVRQTLDLERAPSVSTLKRWRRQAQIQGDDPAAYIPYLDLRGGPGKQRMSSEVTQAINGVLDNFYLTTERYSIKTAYEVLEGQLLEKNKWLPKDQVCKIPSYSTFRRSLQRRSGYEVTAAREGAVHALSVYRPSGKNTELYGLNDCWEIDHTPLDLFVVDDLTGALLGRPRLTAIIEHYSRSIMGFDIGFSGTSAQAALDCLRHAILPKDYLPERFPDVKGDWPCHGIPMVLKCDNGPEFHSRTLQQACFELGIELQYCPVREPWYKARIERFFRTFNESALTGLPGATGSHFYKRPEGSNPAADAVITLQDLQKLLHRWIVEVYMPHNHRGLS